MSKGPKPPRESRGLSKPQRLSTLRLFAILLLFAVLAGYAVWTSERFQSLFQGVSQTRLSEALGAPVTFRTVAFRVFPPSVRLANVRIGNDPNSPDPELRERAFLTAEELDLGGGVSLSGRELRLGRVRAFRAQVSLVQLPDGTLNLPPGLNKRTRQDGGLKLSVGEVLVQQGLFEFDGRKVALDAQVEDLTLELARISGDLYQGSLASRRSVLDLEKAEPILMSRFETNFRLNAKEGLTFETAHFEGAFGKVEATGRIEDFKNTKALFSFSGTVSIEEAERLFHSDLGFAGTADVEGRLVIPKGGDFRLTGRVASPRVDARGFLLEDIRASVSARREALVAEIQHGRYAGGNASGVFRIADLTGQQSPMTLALEGRGISLERFFADLDLPGTGLSGAADMSASLSWGEAGMKRANGGGMLSVRPGPAVSLVRGRHGLPTGGGGAISIAEGRVGFEETTFRLPQSTLTLTGGFRIGEWRPDFDFRLRSEDLSVVDRLFQNFVAATGDRPERLGLAGSGGIHGHLAGTWANPEATAQISAEDAKYADVLFGSVRGTVDIREGAFFFRPLRVYDGEASLSLEGMVAFRQLRGRPRFDLMLAARSFPLSRLLDYLDFDSPIEGLVTLTGSIPISGSPEALSGGGRVEMTNAVLWGQRVPRITGNVLFTPGRLELDDLRATIGGGMIGGRIAFSVKEKTFEARLAGDGIPLSAINVLEVPPEDLTGKLSFQLAGSGLFERPSGTVTASITEASFFGHPVPEGREPLLTANIRAGVLEGSVAVPDRWSLTANGDLFGEPATIELALDVEDLANFLLFTPLELPPGRGGSLAVNGRLVLPAKEGDWPTGVFTMTRFRLDLPARPGVLATSGEVRFLLEQKKLTFQDFQAIGEGTAVKVSGGLDLGEETRLNLSVEGPIDASLLALAVPEVGLTGRLLVDLKATGTLANPALTGRVQIEDGKYRVTGIAQVLDEIDGSISFTGTRGEIDALRARFGGGEVYAAGSFAYEGLALRSFRVTLQGRRVTLRYPEAMRLVVDADLVALRGPQGNTIRGEVVLLRGTYARDFEVSLADLLERTRPSTAVGAREPWKEETRLEVRIVSSTALEVRNNVAALTGAVDLLARGTVADPTLLGQIVLDQGGRLTFRDVRYEIESGTITFTGRELFAPVVDVRARAEVRGYDLVVSLVGTWPRLQTSFSSDPPLPNDTIVALLLTGSETIAGGAESETTGLVSAAGGLVAGAAIGGIARRGQRLFRLDRFEIDPVFSGSQPTDLRTTVGKQITPNLSVTYSQSLYDSSQEPIFRLEWRITDTIVLQGRRDENGVYLLDVRRRQRF